MQLNKYLLITSALRLEKSSGLADFTVWNPWVAGAAKLADMDNEEWRKFICVEATMASKIVHVKATGEKDKRWKASHVLMLTDPNNYPTGKAVMF